MNVGIMSMQRIINYGSFLQAYGLKKTIEKMGHSVQFVDYEIGPPLLSKNVVHKKKNKIIYGLKVVFSKKYRLARANDMRQNEAFNIYYNKFVSDWLPKLELTKQQNIKPELDVLVIGSDEVFNCTQAGENVGYSLQLFGKDNNAKKLISYAASFGSTTKDKLCMYNKYDEIGAYLQKFDAISVRDKNSHMLVSQLTGKTPIDNVDPVLVYDFKEEVNAKININNYVVVYAYSGRINEEEAKIIQEFAHSKGLKTLSIGVMQSFTDEYVCVDPFTMLSYIKNAEYVVTDTFHGTVFSIKYQIPFATIIRDSNKEKLTDLLEKFDLKDRRVNNIGELQSVILKPLYSDDIKEKLQSYREEALTYLNDNL